MYDNEVKTNLKELYSIDNDKSNSLISDSCLVIIAIYTKTHTN